MWGISGYIIRIKWTTYFGSYGFVLLARASHENASRAAYSKHPARIAPIY